jgi:general stress protein 26/nucleoside-triphosphatase THEP1
MAHREPADFMHSTPVGSPEETTVAAIVDWIQQAMRSDRRRPLILSGGIGAGKTQTALHIVQRLRQAGIRVGGIVAPRVIDRGRTVGYAALDLKSGEDQPFARSAPPGHPVGRFYVLSSALAFASDAIDRGLEEDVVVLDEVGRWELQGGGHAGSLRRILAADALPLLLVRTTLLAEVVRTFGLEQAEVFRLTDSGPEGADTFWSLVDSIEFPLLVTRGLDGYPQSRPMHLLEREGNTLWFSTSKASRKVAQIGEHPLVSVLFVDTDRFNYASFHGVATLVDEPERGRRLWREEWREDWPNGSDDPDYVLLRIVGERGYFLRGSSGESGEVLLEQNPP